MSDIFHFDPDRSSFEDLSVPNGTRTWREADVMSAMGYESKSGFRNALNRAMQACLTLSVPTEENFILAGQDYKLTRFACYLVAMNGDPKKPGVAAAQAYFAALADNFQSHIEQGENVDRVLIREEMKTGMKSLGSTAKIHGLENFGFFHNAGYRGMYNMGLRDLERVKRVGPKEQLLDRMGKTELAANLFRVTQTEEKIRNESIYGQTRLENAAQKVGATVRRTMMELSGTPPEKLPLAERIQDVKKRLKSTSREFRRLDSSKTSTKQLKPRRGDNS